MPAKATTFRLEPKVQTQLDHLSGLLNKSMNQLVNEAVKLYVNQRSREAEREMEAQLTKLRAYRSADPKFERAIGRFAEAEAKVRPDPVEGRVERARR